MSLRSSPSWRAADPNMEACSAGTAQPATLDESCSINEARRPTSNSTAGQAR